MPLGDQFKNTFYVDPITGGTKFYSSVNLGKNKPVSYIRTELSPESAFGKIMLGNDSSEKFFATEGKHLADIRAAGANGNAEPQYHQGMFFPPEVGTGRWNDPDIPEEVRRGHIASALHTDSPENYEKSRALEFNSSLSKAKNEEQRKVINDSAFGSGIPTHMFMPQTPEEIANGAPRNINVNAMLQDRSRTQGGHFNSYRNVIRLNNYERSIPDDARGKIIPSTPVVNKGAPIANPDFESVLKAERDNNDARWNSWNGTGKVSKGVRPDGAIKILARLGDPSAGGKNPVTWGMHNLFTNDYDNKNGAEHLQTLKDAGRINLWSGHAKSTKDYIATNFTVDGRKFHTRHESIASGEMSPEAIEIPMKRIASIDQGTLTHEIGHSLDPNVNQGTYNSKEDIKAGADPIQEAIGDGFRDRFTKHKDSFEELLKQPGERSLDFALGNGYTHGHWKNPISKALYSAVRYHTGTSDRAYLDLPNRREFTENSGTGKRPNEEWGSYHDRVNREFLDNSQRVNELALGKMVETMPHVKDMLSYTPYKDIGDAAALKYRQHLLRDQPTLF